MKETNRILEFLCLHIFVSKSYYIEVLLAPFVIPLQHCQILQQMVLKKVEIGTVVSQNVKSALQIDDVNLTTNLHILLSIWIQLFRLIHKQFKSFLVDMDSNCPHPTALSINLV